MSFRAVRVFALALSLLLSPIGARAQADPLFANGFEIEPCGPPGYSRAVSAETIREHWTATTISRPLNYYELSRVHFDRGTYVSLRFDQAMLGDRAAEYVEMLVDTSNTGGVPLGEPAYVSISSCPGGFAGLPSACSARVTEGHALYVAFDSSDPDPLLCKLDSGRNYYMNFVFDDPVDGWQPEALCNLPQAATFCGFRIALYQF